MDIRQFLKRTKLFLNQGPKYIATYSSWRLLRMIGRIRENVIPPKWPDKLLFNTLSSQFKVQLPVSEDELGTALVRHFLNRSEPSFYLSPNQVKQKVLCIPDDLKTDTISLAESILQGKFSYRGITATFENKIDWAHQPESNIDWTWDLNRHYCIVVLAKAYTYTDDEKFAKKAVSLINSWMVHNPPRINNPVWRPFEVSTRLNCWLWAFFLLLKSDYFAKFGIIYMLNGIAIQTHYLFKNIEYHIQNNHLLIEAKTIALLGLCFPEFKSASIWHNTGTAIAWREFTNQVCPDGVHAERSTQYHMLVGSEMWELIRVFEDNELPIPSVVKSRFSKMVDFARAIVKPDQTIPLFGDSSRTDEHIRFDLRWARSDMILDDLIPNEDTHWLLKNFELSSNAQSYLKSAAFFEGGYFIMRDNSSESTPYLAFDCGPFGHKPVPSHGHADALSFELFAFGETLITDCGAYRYHAPAHYRNYFRGVRAHNTIMIDGLDQSHLVGTRSVESPANAKIHRWLSTTYLDIVTGSHDGYARLPEPAIHKRDILFIKPDYWVVLDNILGTGKHQLDWHYHLMPNTEVKINYQSGQAQCSVGRAGLLIQPLCFDTAEVKLIIGDEAEPQGWVSLESGQKVAAPVLNYRCKKLIPFHFGALLIPFPKSKLPSIDIRLFSTEQEVIGLLVRYNGKNDIILLAKDGESRLLTFENWQANASMFIVRQFSSNDFQLTIVNGTTAYWRRKLIFEKTGENTETTVFCRISEDKQSINVVSQAL